MVFFERIFFFCLFFLMTTQPNVALGQQKVSLDSLWLTPYKNFPFTGKEVQIDQLGNIYVISAKNSLEKYNPEGQLLLRYSQNTIGNISQIEVSNPMQLLVFYEDFQKIIFLDRNLTYLSTINLQDWGVGWAKKVAISTDGNLWIYDEIALKLQKYAVEDGKILFESINLSRERALTPSVYELKEQNNQVYLADARQGIFVFDQFGALLRFYDIVGLSSFSLQGNTLIYTTDKGILRLENLQSFQYKQLNLTLGSDFFYTIAGGKLLKISSDTIEILDLN
jgi:hypothetical protein